MSETIKGPYYAFNLKSAQTRQTNKKTLPLDVRSN